MMNTLKEINDVVILLYQKNGVFLFYRSQEGNYLLLPGILKENDKIYKTWCLRQSHCWRYSRFKGWYQVIGPKMNFERKTPSLKLTASLHLKMDGWNTFSFPFGISPYFQGRTVSFRECSFQQKNNSFFWGEFFMFLLESSVDIVGLTCSLQASDAFEDFWKILQRLELVGSLLNLERFIKKNRLNVKFQGSQPIPGYWLLDARFHHMTWFEGDPEPIS